MAYKTRPSPCFLDDMEKWKVIDGRQTYKANNKLYQWDELHGEIEVYNIRGRHIGVLDAKSGKYIKDAVRGRKINV